MPKPLPSPELLRKLLLYRPKTGKLYWRTRTPDMFTESKQTAIHKCNSWNAQFAGSEALTYPDKKGYLTGSILNHPYKSHRVILAMINGEWPKGITDHRDGNTANNRKRNLSEVTHSENSKNHKQSVANTSGTTGVFWNKRCKVWRASIRDNGQEIYLGPFKRKRDAIAARAAAEIKYGYSPRHGKPQKEATK